MFDFLFMILMVGGVVLLGWGVYEALGRIAAHMRGNPDAARAIVEHVLMPLFGETKKEPERKSPPGTAMVVRELSEEPSSGN
jgi:hypothetical protein